MNKYFKNALLILVVLIAGFTRFYKLDKTPPSLNWDEVAAGYNAFTVANWGADEYGSKFPIVFKSFADDKHPVHIYITSIFVKVFGLNDYSVRSSSALMGVLSVIAIYLLAKKLFKSEVTGFLSAIFLAVSPYHLQFSRGLWENNFALGFLTIGLTFFYYGIEKKNWMIPVSFVSFGLSFFSYHSAKVVVPPLVLLVCVLNFKKLYTNKKMFLVSILIGLVFGLLVIKDIRILGIARINQTKFSQGQIDENGGLVKTYFNNYKSYFNYNYLFVQGDQSPRASVKVVGQFYKLDLVLLIIGFIGLIVKKRWKELVLILSWLVLSPIPGAVSSMEPGAIRSIFMIGPVILLSGYGGYYLTSIFKKTLLKTVVLLLVVLFLSKEAYVYFDYYYDDYAEKEAIEWQYGMKDIVGYLKKNPDYHKVYMDKIRQQPYIFFLYYFKTPLPELLETVKYDTSESKSFNTVVSYDKYQFGGNWNIIKSYPTQKIIYIMTPSFYSGLQYKQLFNVKKLIKYPNGSDAFYIVGGDEL